MSTRSGLTEREQYWLKHLRACGNGSLKAYAETHGLHVGAVYAAKSRLKRKGVLGCGSAPSRFVRARAQTPQLAPTLCRIHLRNGAVVEVACEGEQWRELLSGVALLP